MFFFLFCFVFFKIPNFIYQMSNPKRRALVVSCPRFDQLPPDVIVSEILIHFIIGVDFLDELLELGALPSSLFCFGYFNRDVTRHIWAIFRSFLVIPPNGKLSTRLINLLIPLSKIHSLAMPGASFSRDVHCSSVTATRTICTSRVLPNVPMPLLKSVSNVVMRNVDDNSQFRDLDTLILQAPVWDVPDWCVHLRVQSQTYRYHGAWPIPPRNCLGPGGITEFLKPRWIFRGLSARGWMARHLFTHLTPNLREVTLDGSDSLYRRAEKHYNSPTAWDLRNAPKLRKLWIGYGLFVPKVKKKVKKICHLVDFHDFLLPLSSGLDELMFGTVTPRYVKPQWYLPPVNKAVHVTGFAVPPDYEIPKRATFIKCYFDPNHEYCFREPPTSTKTNKSLYIKRCPYLYDDEPNQQGRICIKGNVNTLCYICSHIDVYRLTSSANQGLIGRPFEFVFTGNTSVSGIISNTTILQRRDKCNRAHVALNGTSEIVKVHKCSTLDIDILRCSGHLLVYDATNTVITIAEECVPSVSISDCDDVTLTVPRIATLIMSDRGVQSNGIVVNADICYLRCDNMGDFIYSTWVTPITLTGVVDKAILHKSYGEYIFSQVRSLTVRAGGPTFHLLDPDKLERLTFESMTMEYTESYQFWEMPQLHLPRHKVQFTNVPEDVMQVLLGKVISS